MYACEIYITWFSKPFVYTVALRLCGITTNYSDDECEIWFDSNEFQHMMMDLMG